MEATKIFRCASCDAEVLTDIYTCMTCYDAPKYEDSEHGDIYCNSRCLQEHSQAHQAQCQLRMKRKNLFRAASLMKATFMTFRECLYSRPLVAIMMHNNELHLHIRPTPPFNPWNYPFPEQVTTDAKHKEAAISIENCNAAASICGHLAERLLKDIASEMEMICVDVKPRLLARYITPDKPAKKYPYHTVVVVHLQEEKWIIDMTGSQFGYPDLISPLNKYLRDYEGLIIAEPLPYPVDEINDIDRCDFFPYGSPKKKKKISPDFLAHRAHEVAGRLHLKELIGKRFIDAESSAFVADLLGRTEEAFQEGLGEWVVEVKGHMMDFVQRMTGKYHPTDSV